MDFNSMRIKAIHLAYNMEIIEDWPDFKCAIDQVEAQLMGWGL